MKAVALALVISAFLGAQDPPPGQAEVTDFQKARKEPAGALRLKTVEDLARSPLRRNIPLFLKALEDDARDLGQTALKIDKLTSEIDRLSRELAILAAKSAPGAKEKIEKALEVARGDLNFRQLQAREIERECASLRLGIRDAVKALPEPAQTDEVRTLVNHLKGAQDGEARRQITLTLALLPRPDVLETLSGQATKSREPFARADAAEALGTLGLLEAEPALVLALKDDSDLVRLTAIRSLRRVGGAGGVEALIDAVGREQGRLLDEVLAALRHLTGVEHHDNVALWKTWWEKERQAWQRPGPEGRKIRRPGMVNEPAQGPDTFYGLRVRSNAVVYLIDVSGSMAEKAAAESTTGTAPRDETKLDRARRELIRSVQGLPTGISINVVAYNDKLHPFSPEMVTLTDPTRGAIVAWAKTLRAHGETNIFDSLEMVLKQARGSGPDPSRKMIVDTVFLLTDGLPTAGKILDPELLAAEVARLNSVPRVVIHTIGIGAGHARLLLKRISNESQGFYVAAR